MTIEKVKFRVTYRRVDTIESKVVIEKIELPKGATILSLDYLGTIKIYEDADKYNVNELLEEIDRKEALLYHAIAFGRYVVASP